MARKRRAVLRSRLVEEAASLKSEHGENPEYDRALAELIYWTAGGKDLESVAKEIGVSSDLWAHRATEGE